MTESAQNAFDDARKTARLFEEQLAGLAKQVEESRRAKRQLTERLNLSARRLRLAETEGQWSSALADATRDFADRAAVFTIAGELLRLAAARGLASEPRLDIPLASAPAFAAAAESGDTIVAMRLTSELSEPVAKLVGEAPVSTFSLFPVTRGKRVTAILYADATSGVVDRNALELLTAIAGMVVPTRPVERPEPDRDLVTISNASSSRSIRPRTDQERHSNARRFARVAVSEIRLRQFASVKKGRSNRDLYTYLKQEIDSQRQAFRDAFLSASPTMVDYLHLEILRTLANDDPVLLGPQYPGPMA